MKTKAKTAVKKKTPVSKSTFTKVTYNVFNLSNYEKTQRSKALKNVSRWFKVIPKNNVSRYGNRAFKYKLPTTDSPGGWMEEKIQPECCSRGLHAVPVHKIDLWLERGDCIYEVRLAGKIDVSFTHRVHTTCVSVPSKVAVTKMRLLRSVTRAEYRKILAEDQKRLAAKSV